MNRKELLVNYILKGSLIHEKETAKNVFMISLYKIKFHYEEINRLYLLRNIKSTTSERYINLAYTSRIMQYRCSSINDFFLI